ncbi:MAG TPA: NAD(+)/NADH kinase [Candidatus Dormibacteraeota bacterium]|nr:NAD(+)/NADH kinase [Candidatus Dormibacteraeota bacterium]
MTVTADRGVIAFLLNLKESPGSTPLREAMAVAEAAGFRTVVGQAEPELEILPYLADLRLLVSIGGDGTLLYAARLVEEVGIPVLGVNRGHLGFLANVELPDLPAAIDSFAANRCQLQRRRTLSGSLTPTPGGQVQRELRVAVNEVVIKADAFNLVRLRVRTGALLVGDFDADGLIVATSIGSTAYSLSAGGPPVDPGVPALVVTAINPHALLSRSLVIPDSWEVRVQLLRGRAVVAADGRAWAEMAEGGEMLVAPGPTLDFCEPPGTPDFFWRLRSKTGFGRVLKLPYDDFPPPSFEDDRTPYAGPRT